MTCARGLALALLVCSSLPGKILNVSSRVFVGTGSQEAILTFTLETSQQVLIRHVGPTLATFGVTGTIPDPAIELLHNGVVVASNNDWQDTQEAVLSSFSGGSFSLSNGSKDSAILANLPAGTYQVRLFGSGGVTGAGLCEVFAVGAGASLLQVSIQALSGTGSAAPVVGLLVDPSERKVLIRGVGASAISNGSSNPSLTLYRGAQTLGSNDDWGTDPQAGLISGYSAALSLRPLGNKDSAFLRTLGSGAYTLQSHASFTPGLVRIEIADVTGVAPFFSQADFDTDGKPDLVWRNSLTGEVFLMLMDGTAVKSTAFLGALPVEWQIAGTGDFNADGKTDLIWQNTATGDRFLLLMAGTTPLSTVYLGALDPVLSLVGAGDFNADGKSDLIWQNTATGDRHLTLMDGGSVTANVNLGNRAPAWEIVGSGDFNGDRQTDLIWQNTVTGERSVWLMQGTSLSSEVSLGTVPIEWQIAGAGDFNGDGKSDLIWQNTSTGERSFWITEGGTFGSNVVLGVIPPDWRIVN